MSSLFVDTFKELHSEADRKRGKVWDPVPGLWGNDMGMELIGSSMQSGAAVFPVSYRMTYQYGESSHQLSGSYCLKSLLC